MRSAITMFCFAISFCAMALNGPTVETLKGITFDGRGILFQVYSGGCTNKSDFKLQFNQVEENGCTLTLIRQKQDYCEAYFPYGKMIKFTTNEVKEAFKPLGCKRVAVANPIKPTIPILSE